MNSYRHFRLETDDQGLVWIWMDHADSNANVLSSAVLDELERVVAALEADPPAGVVIASAKASGFCAGADIREFTRITNRDQALALMRRAHALFRRIESLACPTLARIHGFCLGGGLELALACSYRIALDDDRTRLGLPEVRLGIHPGFGGSVRLIRTIGAPAAFDLMLSGRTVAARQARRLGLADHAVAEWVLDRACRQVLQRRPPRRCPPLWLRALDSAPLRPPLAAWLRRQVRRHADPRHYPAPYALIDLWRRHGASDAMFAAEAKSVADLIRTDTARNLVRVFFLRERIKGFGRGDADFTQVHVVGAGTMGGDIAAWAVVQGLKAGLQDRGPQYLTAAVQRTARLIDKRFHRCHQRIAARDRLLPDPKGLEVPRAEVVIEAVVEKLETKQAVFRELEARADAGALLATNTSSIPLEGIAAVLERPGRLVGLHFFNPVAKMPLVEVVSGRDTDPAVAARAAAFARRIDKLPLPVKSAPGFLVNRCLLPYLLEAVRLLEEGVPAPVIDRAATDFGMPMGPIELADTVGLDICLAVAEELAQALGAEVPALLRRKVEAGKLGVKSAEGFYRYKGRTPLKPKAGAGPLPAAEIQDRLILRLVNECVAVLREQVVEDADLVDAGMVFGTGFAPFRGGPLHYARQRGFAAVRRRLEALAEKYGPRFAPDPGWELLQE
ncbi:3-hydroxyacyl-CoA dehydrogenase/enoyl-CoA hydratase/3-hydroxybutyryl-CoA epimerase [Methylomarinovum caldicuralii]|uniref:enoyl-CoA hydratase n=1 Tax=Methylomarinovum caldicuralii TaxID=438856 RepID=A0AAU9CAX1_9GAMM|nr:3-hydroxyacyl-CoA dehydrogenase NAD-binding domain-containing protein [Methylomarinovum caldicuralii]BCX82776.1 3-hydroxyacyl-CoA dehydrogenase/enoyl-CoA hydratase/3-hydroxybutyryl-CoA epimerase [Methylomarinovum caldicuralii]